MKRFALALTPLIIGCASAAQAAPPAPTPPPKPAPTPADDTARIKEEYKALALKNDCTKSYKTLPGTWKFVGQSKTPNYSDVLTIDGTKFKEKLAGNPDGKFVAAEIEGEIRCLFKNRVLIQLDKVAPDGAYGNKSGDFFPCDLLGDMDDKVERILMICYFDWNLSTAAGLEYEYERVVAVP